MKLSKYENHTDVSVVIAAIAANSLLEDACGQALCLHLHGYTRPSPQPGAQHLRTLMDTGGHTNSRVWRGVHRSACAPRPSVKLLGHWLLEVVEFQKTD